MFAEFNWWLLIVGLVVGAGLAWLVLADTRRREEELEDRELASEAVWLEDAMTQAGTPIAPGTAEQLLRLHRAYLGLAPVDLEEGGDPADERTDEPDAPEDPADPEDLSDPDQDPAPPVPSVRRD